MMPFKKHRSGRISQAIFDGLVSFSVIKTVGYRHVRVVPAPVVKVFPRSYPLTLKVDDFL